MARLLVLLIPCAMYVALNVRRLLRGRRWAFTFCQVAKEWHERELDRLSKARENDRQPLRRAVPAAQPDGEPPRDSPSTKRGSTAYARPDGPDLATVADVRPAPLAPVRARGTG